MPKTSAIPQFRCKAKEPNENGESTLFFIAKKNGRKFTFFPGEKCPFGKWNKDAAGKGNGRAKAGMNTPQLSALNDRLNVLQDKLKRVWAENMEKGFTPETFRELVEKDGGKVNSYSLAQFLSDAVKQPLFASTFRERLAPSERTLIDNFIKGMPKMKRLKSVAHGRDTEMMNLLDFSQFYIKERITAKATKDKKLTNRHYNAAAKHLAAFAHVFGEFDFSDVDWNLLEKWKEFSFTEYDFTFLYQDKEIEYSKIEWQTNHAAAVFKRLKKIVKEGVKRHHGENNYVEKRGFGIPWVEGNGAPLYIDDMRTVEGADLSGKDKLANVRLMLFRGFFTALRYGDWCKIGEENIESHDGEDFIEVWAEKTKQPVGIPLLPIFKPVLRHKPRNVSNQKFNDYAKEMLTLLGIDREIHWSDHKGGTRNDYKVPINTVFSAHDLRRSAATFLRYDLSLPAHRIMPITGHKTESTFEKYTFPSEHHLNAASLSREFREKNEKWLMGVN